MLYTVASAIEFATLLTNCSCSGVVRSLRTDCRLASVISRRETVTASTLVAGDRHVWLV
jgi:hypothetical protein